MPYIDLKRVEAKEVIPGYHGKFVHAKNMTTAYWEVDANSAIPEHEHIHEQILNLIKGEFELDIEGEKTILYAGAVVVIPSNVRHAGKSLTHCKIIDVFYPVREDYQSL